MRGQLPQLSSLRHQHNRRESFSPKMAEYRYMLRDLFGVPSSTDSRLDGQGKGQKIPTALERTTAQMRENHEAWHAEMDALVQAALAVAQAARQTAEKATPVSAPASAEATADRMEATARRIEAAIETASAMGLASVLQAESNTSVDAQAPLTSSPPPPLAATYSPFGATPAAVATNPANDGRVRRQACAYCHERGPFFEGVFGGLVCGVHQAMTVSLLHDPSNHETNGYGEAMGSWGATADTGAKKGRSECTLECGNMVTDGTSGSRCTSGHALCADCTSLYVGTTLLPKGTVWFDTIDCVATGCAEHMVGMSVQRCLSRAVMERVNAAQLKVLPEIGPEAKRERERVAQAARLERERVAQAARLEVDRASEKAIATSTMPCPQCGAPSVLETGCNHVRCSARWCLYEYCFACGQEWKGHMMANCKAR